MLLKEGLLAIVHRRRGSNDDFNADECPRVAKYVSIIMTVNYSSGWVQSGERETKGKDVIE